MVMAKIKHRNHINITTFIDGQQINIRNHEGYADVKLAEKLIAGPFGYEWAAPIEKFNPATWTPEYKAISWNMIMPFYEGYGYVGQMMVWGLKKIGIDISVFYKPTTDYMKNEIMDVLEKPKRYDCWGIWHHFWQKHGIIPQEKKAMYTMWESTQLLPDWASALNESNLVLVPAQFDIEIFRNAGVKVPIEILHHGVDQEFYFYRPKQKRDKFIVGTMGSLVPRKNPELLIKAFEDEFANNNDVQLYLKDSTEINHLENYIKNNDGRIVYDTRKVSPYELGTLMSEWDIGVFPSRGEGFGLGGLQSMGVGTTCICTDWSGYKEYLNPEYNYALKYKMVDIKDFPSNNTHYSGQWAEADYEHLRQLLRYAYEHRDEVHEKGKKAAQWVKDHWTWQRCAQQLIDAIDKYEQNKS